MRSMGRDNRRRGGYTLAEMLVVVAIIGILAAVAIPSVFSYRRSLKLTELDDSARTIYLAAQNHLSALRSASGETLELGGTSGRGAADVPNGAVPGVDPAEAALKYVSTDVSSAQPGWLVLPGSVDSDLTEKGHYLVEFDPASGVVYGVFYTEERALSAAAYQTLFSFTDGGSSCRVREGRNAFASASGGFLVGYYGADGALDLSRLEGEELPTPKVKLINNEELKLEFSATAEDGVDTGRIFYSVSVTGPDATGNDCAKTLVDKGVFNSGAVNTLVLDTLKGGYSKTPGTPAYGGWTAGSPFAGWAGSGSIVPGANITVSVTTWYEPDAGEGVSALPKTVSVTTNSLFGQRVGEKVEVGYGRHLQNLGAAGLDSAITQAVQVRDIDFEKTTPTVGDEGEHWAETYGALKFAPIYNNALTEFDGQERVIRNLNVNANPYAGLFSNVSDATLANIVMEDAKVVGGGCAGTLAGVADKTTVDNCRVYLTAPYTTNPRVRSGGDSGGLIGHATDVTIQNGSFAATVVGGESGDGSVIGSAGGLVGRGDRLTIENSYAACYLSGNTAGGLVGATTYTNSPVTIRNSYAAGTVANATGAAAGLLVPHTGATEAENNITVQNAYAAVDYISVPADGKVYGAVPVGTCTNVFYLPKYGVNDANEVAGVTLVPSSTEMVKAPETGVLGALTAFKDGPLAKAYPYNHVTRTEEEGGPLTAPYPYPTLGDLPHYGDWLVTVAPPKPQSLIVYYEQFQIGGVGDFVTECSYTLNGVEKGTLDLTRTEAINAEGYAFLSPIKLHNTSWSETSAKLTVTAVGKDTKTTTVQGNFMGPLDEELGVYQPVSGIEPAYYAYSIPMSALDVIPNGVYYLDVTVQGVNNNRESEKDPEQVETTAWVNPLFSRSAYNGTKPTATPDPIHIRSLRQLANMGRFFGKQNYVQDLDIDAQIYVGNLAANWNGPAIHNAGVGTNDKNHVTIAGFEVWGRDRWSQDHAWGYATDQWNLPEEYHLIFDPIATHYSPDGSDKGKDYEDVTSFGRSYDGNGRVIRALSIRQHMDGSIAYAGLFYRINSDDALLRNITLEDCDIVGKTGNSANSTGTLVGRVSGGRVENCKVSNCTVTVEGTKAGGHMGGFTGYADNSKFIIDNCTVENCDVAGGAYSRNVGGFVGHIQKQKDGSAIRNCTVKNVSVSNHHTGKSNEANLARRGAAGGFLGSMMENSGGTVENCAVIGTGGLQVSGDTWYSGGFVGVMADNTIQNCAVRLEGKPGQNYESQGVEGGKATGGFAGALTGGSISGSYASVKVDGADAGGFVGELSGGSVSNSYAGGRTKNARYTASLPNVTGTGQTGGFIGLWKGGSLDTCYTTCAVSGPNDAATDVFANQASATLNSPVPGCYALGTAFVGGAKRDSLTQTKVATTMTALDAGACTETHAYDTALTEAYPYAPVKDAAGNPVPHYGDWPGNKAPSPARDWVQQIAEPKGDAQYEDFSADATWAGDDLNLTFDVHTVNAEQNAANSGPNTNGFYSVATDLGYTLIFRIVYNGSTGEYEIKGIDGATVSVSETAPMGTTDRHIVLNLTIPTDQIPPYKETINIGAMDAVDYVTQKPEKYILTNITNSDSSYHGVAGKDLDATITVDGDFSDWAGYEHQLMESYPAGEQTPLDGHWTASILGYENKIYVHMINEDPADTFNPKALLNFKITALDKEGNALDLSNMQTHQLTNTNIAVPGKTDKVIRQELWGPNESGTWVLKDTFDIFHLYYDTTNDRLEYEMEMDLDEWAQVIGAESGDVFGDIQLSYGDYVRVLEVKRVPKE